MKKTELVFVPLPARGHLFSTVEFASELLRRDDRFSVTILVTKSPFTSESNNGTTSNSTTTFDSLGAHQNIQFVDVPTPQQLPPRRLLSECMERYIGDYMESHKSIVKDIITDRFKMASGKLSGLVLDMFCSAMIGVAKELNVPSYVFFTSGAAFLGFMLYLHARHVCGGRTFEKSDPDSNVPSYANPVPARVLPSLALSKNSLGYEAFVNHGREFKRTDGIIINTVLELESHAVGSFADGVTPPVYTVGPLLDLKGKAHQPSDRTQDEEIIRWLDDQPEKSVVFLCFGSLGAFHAPQLGQIAIGLEQSGQRFLWSVCKAPSQDNARPEYLADIEEFLPQGFLDRTKGLGLLCGWAPQIAVLAHKAVGGFVSHCGWNSILESLWFGVPIATWPLYAEQQINAFLMLRDLGLAVELSLDYRKGGSEVVTADELERAVRCVMNDDSEVRKRVEKMSEKCRKAVAEGGSSFESLGRLIDDILANVT